MFGKFSVLYNPDGIENFLSLITVTNYYLVTYKSSDRGGVFTAHTPKGIIESIPYPSCLHYLDFKINSIITHPDGHDNEREL